MPFSNQDYLFRHLPARFQREGTGGLLYRFLSFFGDTLDQWDDAFANFSDQIAAASAREDFITWWLYVLFGWSWFPRWFTLADKRALYASFARYLAERGTAKGIEEFLSAFGVTARAYTQQLFFNQTFFGLDRWALKSPLKIVVDVLSVNDRVNPDACFFGLGYLGLDMFAVEIEETLTKDELGMLVEFGRPIAQVAIVNHN